MASIPEAYLTDVLTKLVNNWPNSRLAELTPWAWATHHCWSSPPNKASPSTLCVIGRDAALTNNLLLILLHPFIQNGSLMANR
jgi:hypothetical protein